MIDVSDLVKDFTTDLMTGLLKDIAQDKIDRALTPRFSRRSKPILPFKYNSGCSEPIS